MTGMRLDHHRASRAERAHGVRSRHGDGERKIARAENHDRPDRLHHAPHIRFRQRLAVRDGPIDARLEPGAFADKLGKQPRLTRQCVRAPP